MLLESFVRRASLVAFASVYASVVSAAITIPTVSIGNSGNAADPTTGYGSVTYTYNIGATEVTNAQYAAFLNAVAATDTHDLYATQMIDPPSAGIERSGASGSYTYAVIPGRANHPVNWTSFWDAIRFANWLHNGQPTGPQNSSTTEDGAYTLTPGGVSDNTIARNVGWRWAVTSENEWYKAAYYQPAALGGDADNYWRYPTASNTLTTAQANYVNVGLDDTVPVGSYAPNFYGTFDMGGNVNEWNETTITGSVRGVSGGSFTDPAIVLRADMRYGLNPIDAGRNLGFRVSRSVPSCAADFNADGFLTFEDFDAFVNAFEAGAASADFNADGFLTFEDFDAFVSAFETGC